MKRILFLFAVLFLYGSSVFAQGWEGMIEMSMKSPQLGDESMPMVMKIKGNKVHTTMEMGPMGSVEMVNVMRAMNMGIEMDLSQMEASTESRDVLPKPVATGKKEKINGFNCEEFTCKIKEIDMELWMTKDLPPTMTGSIQSAMKNVSQSSGADASAFEELAKQGFIAIRTIVKQDGTVQAQMEIIKYETKTFPDSEFTVPSNINIQKMDPSMMGGMGR
jgi:hypothetical protein